MSDMDHQLPLGVAVNAVIGQWRCRAAWLGGRAERHRVVLCEAIHANGIATE